MASCFSLLRLIVVAMAETEESKFNLAPSPKKRKKLSATENRRLCIICLKCDRIENLVSPKETGGETSYRCLTINKDEPYRYARDNDLVADNGFIADINYHRGCYQTYTHKKAGRHNTETDQPCTSQSLVPSMITTGSKTHQFDKSKCHFCNCIRKTNDIKLINASSPKIQDTIVGIARALENHELLTKVLGINLIAAEAKYHNSCLGNAVTKSSRKQMASGETSDQSDYVFEKAFNILVDEINDDLMNGVAFEM